MKFAHTSLAAVLAFAALTPLVHAERVVALTRTQQLVQFDSSAPGSILATSPVISGLASGDRIVDLDFYPVNNLLHGLGTSGNLYRIDPTTGAASIDVVPQSSLGTPRAMDFNPTVDRLRVISANNANYRLTPSVNTAGSTGPNAGLVSTDGTFMYASGGATPNLVAAAYTNNFDGATSTTLYSIDANADALVIHSVGPQFSTLTMVGPLGFDVGERVGFDVSGATSIAYVSNGNALFTANLMTGALSSIGTIGGPLDIDSIAVVPTPGVLGICGAAALLSLRRRR
jgi:hypothetical protein